MSYNPGMDNWPHRTIPRPLQAIGLTAAALCLMGAVKGDDRIHPDPCNHWVAPTAQIKSKANVDEAVKLHPNLALAYLERGNEYLSEAEIEKAKADFNKAISLDPRCARAYMGLYFVLSDGHHANESLAALKKAAEVGPADLAMDALNLQAHLHLHMKQFALARDEFARVIKADVFSKRRLAYAYKHHGVCNDRLGKVKEAIADYTTAVKYDPTDGQSYLFRANDYRALGDLKNSKADYDLVASHIIHVPMEKREEGFESVRNDLYLFRSDYYRQINRPDLAKADLEAMKRQQAEDIDLTPFQGK